MRNDLIADLPEDVARWWDGLSVDERGKFIVAGLDLMAKLEQVEKERDYLAMIRRGWRKLYVSQCEQIKQLRERLSLIDRYFQDGQMWSFLRRVLSYGHAQHQDYVAGGFENYEMFSAHVDGRARDFDGELQLALRGREGG